MKKYKGLIILLSLILIMIATYILFFNLTDAKEAKTIYIIIFQLIGIILVLPLFVAVHEAGHMVFGLISGYSLLTYKVGPFEWYEKDEKLAFRVNSLNSMVLGQCLMVPPKPKKKVKPKFFLYNAGGLIFSYLMDIILIILFFIINNVYFKYMLIPMITVSIFLTLNNSIYQQGGINDVCNHVVVKRNPKYINSIMFQLEMVANITKGKRYGAKTLYEPYFENKLNHITLPVSQFRFLYAIDKGDFEEAKRISNIMKNNYRSIPFAIHRVSLIFNILYADIVVNESMSDFRRHFKWIGEKDKILCQKYESEIKYYYEIYNNIYNHNYEIKKIIDELLASDILASGERLSLEKMFNFLTEKLAFYVENGNSFIVKE